MKDLSRIGKVTARAFPTSDVLGLLRNDKETQDTSLNALSGPIVHKQPEWVGRFQH